MCIREKLRKVLKVLFNDKTTNILLKASLFACFDRYDVHASCKLLMKPGGLKTIRQFCGVWKTLLKIMIILQNRNS